MPRVPSDYIPRWRPVNAPLSPRTGERRVDGDDDGDGGDGMNTRWAWDNHSPDQAPQQVSGFDAFTAAVFFIAGTLFGCVVVWVAIVVFGLRACG